MTVTQYFNSTYQQLSRFEQIILQICSVIYEPTDTSTILRCLYSSKIPTDIPLSDYPRQVETSFKRLEKLKLLQVNHTCRSQYVELISRQSVRENNFSKISTAIKEEMPSRKFPLTGADPANSLRDLRIDLYNNDIDNFHQQLVILLGEQRTIAAFPVHPMVTICNNPFDPAWFSSLPPHIQFFAMHEIVKHSIQTLSPLDDQLNYLLENGEDSEQNLLSYPSFLYLLISVLLLQGKIKEASKLTQERADDLGSLGLQGWVLFISGKNSDALKYFEKDLTLLRDLNNQEDAFFTGFEGIIYCLALLKDGQPESLNEVQKISQTMRAMQNNIFAAPYSAIYHLTREAAPPSSSITPPEVNHPQQNSVHTLLQCLVLLIKKGRLPSHLESKSNSLLNLATDNGYMWLAMEYAEILFRATGRTDYHDFAINLRKQSGACTITDAIRHKERWQLAIADLDQLNSTLGKESKSGTRRLAWLIKTDKHLSYIQIFPKEQRFSTNGSWSKGRTISTKRLFHQEDLEYLSDQDKKICATILRKKSPGGAILYYFPEKQALLNMVGHRHIFMAETPHIHLDIYRGEPELRVNQKDENIELQFYPDCIKDKIVVIRESFSSLRVIAISDDQQKVAEIIGPYGLTVPAKARKKVLRTVGNTATHLNIFSDLGGIETGHQEVDADNRIYLQITPTGTGFRVGMYVRPFDSKGPYFKPGLGPATIFSEINNKLLQTNRDFNVESSNAQEIEDYCQILTLHEDGDRDWHLPTPSDCLEFLYKIKELDNIVLEWPKGEQMQVTKSAGTSHCHLKIVKENNWFSLDGDVKIDEDEVFSLLDLLKAVRKSSSRFIELKDNEFLALTEELYSSIEVLESCSHAVNEQLTLLPIAAKALEDITESGIKVDAATEWHYQIDKITAATNSKPKLPTTMQAVLRDYQLQGFRWLMRLNSWGAGACLADDMGIGKTIQSLAVILAKASRGPSLVVAPTSVCFNWKDEIKRFTPTLIPKSFHGDDRQNQLQQLGPFDVFITSYGLLQQVPELAEREWQVIVLDEGHAIKNANTKRSAAAMELKADFKIVTTGTPIENNLGELWNLFRFINPGLLGSLKQFNKRFAAPIEKDKNRNQRNRLRSLISPFILRRLKSQVLEELPPRTEVNLFVDFDEEENNFYEALRRQSLQKIKASDHSGQKRIKILAEIMQLRRACCNPKLIAPTASIDSSKLRLFEDTIDELLANNHKTLVFSQFVDHLSILRESLNKKNVKYQYLDGSTPAKVRKMRVDAFQAGHGDVFLISLKAGGVGLNLTAANYVIHMDPWWNPAVEDQASDRAHRLGQEQPVTIYKLITRNTIEEKIVKLHQQKRDLANQLLSGTDISTHISADDLLILLQDTN